MLTITKRNAKMGGNINTRAEKHGDEDVTALDIPLSAIMLNENELNAIMQEPHAHNLLFSKKAPGEGAVPVFTKIKPIKLANKIEEATVELTFGLDLQVIRLAKVKLASVELEPLIGGYTAMSLKVQCTPELNESLASLLGRLNGDVDVEITVDGFGDQKDLPLQGGAPTPTRRRRASAENGSTAH